VEALEDRRLLSSGFFQQTNLVSDQPGVALIQDTNLVNAWGISLSPTVGAFWVSDNETGKTTLYAGDVHGGTFFRVPLVVTIPSESADQGFPTGQVFNGTSDFEIGASGAALFMFASQTGEIAAWNFAQGTTAQVVASVDGAVYTGLAIGAVGTDNYIYAANLANGSIDVFNGDFALQSTEAFPFSDPTIPPRYGPFNIQNLGGRLYVTYAQRAHDEPGEESGHGAGFVDVFDTSGHLLQRIVSGNHLSAPWGLAIAPSDFGPFGGALLVGNFGKGTISAFDVTTGKFLGQLKDATGKPIVIDGLWGMTFGNGVSAGDTNALYFAAGPDDETHGLFGSLRFVASASTSTGANLSAAAGLLAATGPANSLPAGPASPSGHSSSTLTAGSENSAPGSVPPSRRGTDLAALVVHHSSHRSSAGQAVIDAIFGNLEPLSVRL
jgi:uncharacterized protein (TIGR03118 family)